MRAVTDRLSAVLGANVLYPFLVREVIVADVGEAAVLDDQAAGVG